MWKMSTTQESENTSGQIQVYSEQKRKSTVMRLGSQMFVNNCASFAWHMGIRTWPSVTSQTIPILFSTSLDLNRSFVLKNSIWIIVLKDTLKVRMNYECLHTSKRTSRQESMLRRGWISILQTCLQADHSLSLINQHYWNLSPNGSQSYSVSHI